MLLGRNSGPDASETRASERRRGRRRRICKVTLDERTVVRRSPEVEHERAVAIFDLIEESHFAPVGDCPRAL